MELSTQLESCEIGSCRKKVGGTSQCVMVTWDIFYFLPPREEWLESAHALRACSSISLQQEIPKVGLGPFQQHCFFHLLNLPNQTLVTPPGFLPTCRACTQAVMYLQPCPCLHGGNDSFPPCQRDRECKREYFFLCNHADKIILENDCLETICGILKGEWGLFWLCFHLSSCSFLS